MNFLVTFLLFALSIQLYALHFVNFLNKSFLIFKENGQGYGTHIISPIACKFSSNTKEAWKPKTVQMCEIYTYKCTNNRFF